MAHHCHAVNCDKNVPPKMLMCLKHWRMLTSTLQRNIWATYRVGQELDKRPSYAYILAQRAAVWHVFVKEGGCELIEVPEIGSTAYLLGPIASNTNEQT